MKTIRTVTAFFVLLPSCAQTGATAPDGVGAYADGASVADGSGNVAQASTALESGLTIDNIKVTGKLEAAINSGVVMVDQLASSGTGAADNPWTSWEYAVNSMPPGVEFHFPAGHYAQGSTIQVKNGWTLRGAGKDATFIVSANSFTGDAIQSISPYNGSTAVRLVVEDMQLVSTNPVPTGAGIDIVAGSFVSINRVYVSNYKYGTVLDQAELVDIEDSEFAAGITNATAGVWLVNGTAHQDEHVAGVPLSPAPLPRFTNRIGIRKTQFNSVGFVGIVDDGGDSHVFDSNNFNGGANGLRLAEVSAGRVTGNQMGFGTGAALVSAGGNVGLYIGENHVSVDATWAMRFDGGVQVTLANNVAESTGPAFSGISNIHELTAMGNRQIGNGTLYDGDPVTGTVQNGGLGIQTANPGAELEVNGGVRLNTSKGQPPCGPATRGEIWFSQGTVNVKDSLQVCAKGSANNYLWRTLY